MQGKKNRQSACHRVDRGSGDSWRLCQLIDTGDCQSIQGFKTCPCSFTTLRLMLIAS